MARPKGVQQKRNDSKYILPDGVTVKPHQGNKYTKETKLIFIDSEFGEFISSFKAIINAGASTHPKAVQKRREETNKALYGGSNPSHSKHVRKKAEATMIEKYSVKSALQNKELLNKAKQTLMNNYGVDNPSKSDTIQDKQQQTNIAKYGSPNAMGNVEIRNKVKNTLLKRYGVDNPAQYPAFKEKALESMTDSDGLKKSKGELEVKQFIESLGLSCKNGYIGGRNPKQIDIKIDEKNIGIEYNGAYWHSEANKSMYPKYHLHKTFAAKEQGLNLIHIFDFEWENRQEQVKSFLKSKLGMNTKRYRASKLSIKEINKEEAKVFLDTYHILGAVSFNKAIGLCDGDELISLITINKHHRNNNQLLLNRFVTKTYINVTFLLSILCRTSSKEF